jgi:hypothetical protein
MVVTAMGERRPIRWIGSRTIDCNAYSDPRTVWPIRVAPHAFGDNRPSRPLFVSPAHAFGVTAVEDVLIPACRLLNGSTIARHPVAQVVYWHVELDSHDLLVAEGTPAESYLESGNRSFFAGNREAPPEPRERPANGLCLPFIEQGPILAFVREALNARARRLGWTPSEEVEAALIVDGETVAGSHEGLTLIFRFPASASDVCLRSDSFSPDDLNGHDDRRRLGLNIRSLTLQSEDGEMRRIALDDERLGKGFHDVERHGDLLWRWSDGAASLPDDLWEDLVGELTLRVVCDGGGARSWKAPLDAGVARGRRPAFRLVG